MSKMHIFKVWFDDEPDESELFDRGLTTAQDGLAADGRRMVGDASFERIEPTGDEPRVGVRVQVHSEPADDGPQIAGGGRAAREAVDARD